MFHNNLPDGGARGGPCETSGLESPGGYDSAFKESECKVLHVSIGATVLEIRVGAKV